MKNKYFRTIDGVDVDVYAILLAFDVRCPAINHAIKKLLMPGQRGYKSRVQDLEEAIVSIQRSIELSNRKVAASANYGLGLEDSDNNTLVEQGEEDGA